MPYSYAVYTGNGSTTQFAITFPYIRKEHVKCYVNYVDTAYTYVNDSLIQLATAPGNGLRVEVRRVTPANNVLVDFTDGSTLVAADLDTSNLQHLYLEQELDDAFKQNISIDSSSGLPSANNQRIINVANPVNAQDAATKAYVNATVVAGLVPNGDYGDITVSSNGALWQIDAGVAVNKLANGTARQLLQTNAAGTGVEWTNDISLFGIFSASAGTAALPSITFIGDSNTGIYLPGADTLAISTNGAQRVTVDSTGKIAVNTTTADKLLTLAESAGATLAFKTGANTTSSVHGIEFYDRQGTASFPNTPGQLTSYIRSERTAGQSDFNITFGTTNSSSSNATERARLDSSGRFLVGTSTAVGTSLFQVVGDDTARPRIHRNANDIYESVVFLSKSRGTSYQSVLAGDVLGKIIIQGADGTGLADAAHISAVVEGTPATGKVASRLVFSTTADGASSPTERMRIGSDGWLYVNTTNKLLYAATGTTKGLSFDGGELGIANSSNVVLYLNRTNNDGDLVRFFQDGANEGSISVSGTTVSYNGAHLSRWSQLPGGVERTEILRGTVLSNIDEMCEWGDEDNEQLNRMKVSDVEGDKNVSGVFQAWDDDDDTYTNDFYCAMTGDFIIRIGAGITVERGDLLMSTGDGTAKPQNDDIIRSKTIAKVTSTNVSCTYDDGSYCVPCVLMAC